MSIGPSLWISCRTRHHPVCQICFQKQSLIKQHLSNLKTSNNIQQSIDDTDLKQPKIHRKICTSLWILKKEKNLRTKSLKIFAISLGFLIKIHRLGNGFKTIYRKSIERVDFYSLWFPFQLPINPNFHSVERQRCLLWWRHVAITSTLISLLQKDDDVSLNNDALQSN